MVELICTIALGALLLAGAVAMAWIRSKPETPDLSCPECGGTGWRESETVAAQPCHVCNGTGIIPAGEGTPERNPL